ncbi:nucleoside monophosphate kinase [Candidatus Uhrbacteria bacterium]|jgi:adenylate kinase|nr:nucleoside monophosphate kinase [Candidatus Uhrbacteria bacterium]
MNEPLKILLMGPQGSGKGTQAEILSEQFGIPAFGMGQLIRDEVASGSEYGKKLEAIINKGDLVSDEDAAGLLKLRLERPDTNKGYILDGYPRNMGQFNAFNFDSPTHVIVYEIPRDESLKRLGGRLTCAACGKVTSVSSGVSAGDDCSCGDKWIVRNDDTPEAITRRLEIYENDTQPVIEQYKEIVHRIDGVGTIEEVSTRTFSAISVQ